MKNIKGTLFLLLAVFAILDMSSYSRAQDTHDPGDTPFLGQKQTATPIEKVSPGVFRIGNILINKETRSITFPALVNMDKGLLEYLLVYSSGKTHESLLRTRVEPYNLQLAFLLLGFEGTDSPLAYQGSPEKPKGEPLEITIVYTKGEAQTVKINAGEWMVQRMDNTQKEVGKLDWVFTGSLVVDGQFLAQSEGSIAAIFHDPVALIDNASTGGESDEIWFVKEKTVPPAGTPVTVSIKAKK